MANYYAQHKPGGDDGLYLKLKDSDSVKLRIVSECAITTYDGKKLRYNWVVWNRDLKKPQVYSAGVSVYSQIADLTEDWGNPTEFDVRIKRTGATQFDTSYSVSPVKESNDITKVEQEAIDKVELEKAVPKSRWLADFVEDGEMPETLESTAPVLPEQPVDLDAPINLDDIPF